MNKPWKKAGIKLKEPPWTVERREEKYIERKKITNTRLKDYIQKNVITSIKIKNERKKYDGVQQNTQLLERIWRFNSMSDEKKARNSPSLGALLRGSCDYVYKITSKICSATSVWTKVKDSHTHTGIPWALQLLWLKSPTDKATLSFAQAVATALALSYTAVQLLFDV